MEVLRQNFSAKLPFILEDIARSECITIDLELSGIPGQQLNKPRRMPQARPGYPPYKRGTRISNAPQSNIKCFS